MVLDAGVDEFLLEDAVELQPGDVLQGRKGAAQEVARAAFPRYAGGGSDVAQEKMLGRRAVLAIHLELGRRIGDEDQVAGRAKGRVGDRSERRDHRVGGHPADARFQPGRQIGDGKALAPHAAGDLAGAHQRNRFADHGRDSSSERCARSNSSFSMRRLLSFQCCACRRAMNASNRADRAAKLSQEEGMVVRTEKT